jgi:uncharacterized protein YdhG (YjbR/CyaY superfamily)
MKEQYATIDEYIKTAPAEIQPILEKIRQTIRKAAPGAVETISYQMPAFKLNGRNLVYFAAFKNHIGFYPLPAGIESFEKELAPYAKSKGTVQFQLDQPIPYELIDKIVKFRATQNSTPKATKGEKR